jgi:hypothetical protein
LCESSICAQIERRPWRRVRLRGRPSEAHRASFEDHGLVRNRTVEAHGRTQP